MKISIKLLTVSVLLSAVTVNINPSYCMEEIEENEIQMNNQDEIQEEIYFVKTIYDKYCTENNQMQRKELLNQFCNYLFGEDGNN